MLTGSVLPLCPLLASAASAPCSRAAVVRAGIREGEPEVAVPRVL